MSSIIGLKKRKARGRRKKRVSSAWPHIPKTVVVSRDFLENKWRYNTRAENIHIQQVERTGLLA